MLRGDIARYYAPQLFPSIIPGELKPKFIFRNVCQNILELIRDTFSHDINVTPTKYFIWQLTKWCIGRSLHNKKLKAYNLEPKIYTLIFETHIFSQEYINTQNMPIFSQKNTLPDPRHIRLHKASPFCHATQNESKDTNFTSSPFFPIASMHKVDFIIHTYKTCGAK